jgi:hypothetical protein
VRRLKKSAEKYFGSSHNRAQPFDIKLYMDGQRNLISKVSKTPKLAQKLGQLQPFLAVFPQECVGKLASFGRT